mgnify:CR=1 FL=1
MVEAPMGTFMTAFTTNPDNQLFCPKCQNKGYYPFLIQPIRAEDSPQQTVMFCACLNGRQLRQITVEFRLNDLEELAGLILPMLEKTKDEMHKPNDALKTVNQLIDQINELLGRIRNAERDERANQS